MFDGIGWDRQNGETGMNGLQKYRNKRVGLWNLTKEQVCETLMLGQEVKLAMGSVDAISDRETFIQSHAVDTVNQMNLVGESLVRMIRSLSDGEVTDGSYVVFLLI